MSVDSPSVCEPNHWNTFLGLPQGGELVTARAGELVKGMSGYFLSVTLHVQPLPELLKPSKFNTPEDVVAFTQKFDEGVKRVFSDDKGTQYVKFGSLRDNDPKHGIKAGKLMLTG
jgi:hypothetical protein